MSPRSARRVLVIGGTRSGKSTFAETLVAEAITTATVDGRPPAVRYVATAATDASDAQWTARIEAHRSRRPADWTTDEIGADPGVLADLLAGAAPDSVVLVDDLGGWLTGVLQATNGWDDPTVALGDVERLASAVRDCPAARLVLVGQEVGLSLVAQSVAGRAFADANGTTNRVVGDACDAVALVVAGRPLWLDRDSDQAAQPAGRAQSDLDTRPDLPEPGLAEPGLAEPDLAQPDLAQPDLAQPDLARTPAGPDPTGPARRADAPVLSQGMDVPGLDDLAATAATDRLTGLDLPGSGFGTLVSVIRFAGGTQATATPQPWRQPHVVVLHGDHAGGVAAGDSPADSARRLEQTRSGIGPTAVLAQRVRARITVHSCPAAAAIEQADALDEQAIDEALATGWHLAESCADSGDDLIVLGACGSGTAGAAAAVATRLGAAEPAALLPLATGPTGRVDDESWMRWCVAVRDAVHRMRTRPTDPRTLLIGLGGGDLAVATGLLLGAATRRTPVLIDGPVGAAAALLAREFAPMIWRWLLTPDHGRQPVVARVGAMLHLDPLLDLRLGLGEGATALAALPVMQSMLTVAAAAPTAATEPPAED